MRVGRQPKDDYTLEEREILASLRKKSGRTCVNCAWYMEKGQHRGCYPDGKWRKFLSKSEFEAGCDSYSPGRK
jgi:hypothetical protein